MFHVVVSSSPYADAKTPETPVYKYLKNSTPAATTGDEKGKISGAGGHNL